MDKEINKLKFFISYSHKNIKYKEKFLTSLETLKNTYNIAPWHDGMIPAGGIIDNDVKQALLNAHIVLLIVTNDFLTSHYCIQIELEEAIKREKAGQCIVIPVMFQESVLTDNLAFIKHNRVPQDGKPIATGFKNQSVGCTRAVNMIKDLIDSRFPNCKKVNLFDSAKQRNNKTKSAQKLNHTKPKRINGISQISNTNIPHIELYKNGKLSKINLTQDMVDKIPKFHTYICDFSFIMEQSLLDAKKRYNKLYKSKTGNEMSNEEKLNQLRLYLMDICAYTKTYITENVGIKVHFRASKNGYYLGLIASTDDDNAIDLSSDWTTKMTPIPMYQGLIYHSSTLHAPIIKSLNTRLNFKAVHDETWKDYITFTFPKFHTGQTPLISYCISIHKDYYKAKSDMLKILAYLNFGEVIEKYIDNYCNICKGIDPTYNIVDIINTLTNGGTENE